ncbi:hypothetical protein H0H92_011802 [Tricholoma furcatifolium]|nr:hypothetical protein H0H92_011802 [Tricholoma furcatifolium]
MFRQDTATLVELLIRTQSTIKLTRRLSTYARNPVDPADTQLGHYLTSTWAKEAIGPEFEPYIHVVVPTFLQTAIGKPDVSVCDEDEEEAKEREGWETGVRDAHDNNPRWRSITTMGAGSGCYAHPHAPRGRKSEQHVDSADGLGGVQPPHRSHPPRTRFVLPLIALQMPQRRRRACVSTKRTLRCGPGGVYADDDKEEMTLIEEVEELVLETMGKILAEIDPAHSLLIAVLSVKDLACYTWNEEEDE